MVHPTGSFCPGSGVSGVHVIILPMFISGVRVGVSLGVHPPCESSLCFLGLDMFTVHPVFSLSESSARVNGVVLSSVRCCLADLLTDILQERVVINLRVLIIYLLCTLNFILNIISNYILN